MTLYSLHLLQPHHIWGPLEEDACVRILFTDSSLACNIIMLQYVPGKLSSLDINTSFLTGRPRASWIGTDPHKEHRIPMSCLLTLVIHHCIFRPNHFLRLQITPWCGSPQQQWVIKQKGATFLVNRCGNKKLSLYIHKTKGLSFCWGFPPPPTSPVYISSSSVPSHWIGKKGSTAH